ncbi:MAG: dihydroneopterin aldolase [Bacteroidales bacterium]
MALIELEEMVFYAYHGCYKEERLIGNKFLVNLTISADLEKPAASDSIEDTLNYQIAYETVKEEMNVKSHLLEHVAGRILDRLYRRFPEINEATVKVSKMNPPMGGQMEKVSVTLTR